MALFTLLVTLGVCITMMVFVLVKPQLTLPIKYKEKKLSIESFYIVAILAPIILLCFGAVSPQEVWNGITSEGAINPIKILILFMSMCFISIVLDKAGFFEFCAYKVMTKVKTSQFKLFILLYIVVAILTIFTSNDIIILTFTPFIFYFCKSAKISPLPYIISEFVAANTFSLMLIIGNPTNIYIGQSAGLSFSQYFGYMFVPALVSGLIAFALLLLMFYKKLKVKMQIDEVLEAKLKDKTVAFVALVFLVACVVVLAVSSNIDIEMWLISLVFAVALCAFMIILNLVRRKRKTEMSIAKTTDVIKGLPYSVVPFLLSMFVAILALQRHGVTDFIATKLMSISTDPFSSSIIFGFASALTSNIINNIPMSVLFSGILNSAAVLNSSNMIYAVCASIIGSNIGAFFSPLGALAGIMFIKLSREKEMSFTIWTFLKYCVPIAVVTLICSCIALAIVV